MQAGGEAGTRFEPHSVARLRNDHSAWKHHHCTHRDLAGVEGGLRKAQRQAHEGLVLLRRWVLQTRGEGYVVGC